MPTGGDRTPEPASPDLVNSFSDACEAVYRRMHRNRARASALRADGASLSDAEFAVITPLTEAPGLTVGRLAAEVGVSSPTLSRSLSRLEDGGLVVRERVGPSGHRVEVRVTDAGLRAWAQARDRTMARQRHALEMLPPGRRDAVVVALRELAAAIDAADDAGSDGTGPGTPVRPA